MGATGKRSLANAIIAAVLLIGLAHFGATAALGAHPGWAVKIVYIGVGFGIVIYSLFWVWQGGWLAKFIAYLALIGIAAGVTAYGKSRFLASDSLDMLAGQIWYFGWIGAIGLGFALLMHLLSARP